MINDDDISEKLPLNDFLNAADAAESHLQCQDQKELRVGTDLILQLRLGCPFRVYLMA